jgi:diguanylate cyclase (GGDEF)-like protein
MEMVMQEITVPPDRSTRRGLSRLTEATVLFPLLAVLLLLVIWTGTLELARLKGSDAAHVAALSSRELLGTYEAQVVRALREIDQTLNLVKYWHESGRSGGTLADLRDKGLLPPDLLFAVSIANRRGEIVDSTRSTAPGDISAEDYFRAPRAADALFIGQPHRGPADGATLRFSRRLNASDGSFDGVVIVGVDASYFVSGYDSAKLGQRGVLGIVGADGLVRIRRSGEAEFAGDRIDYAGLLAASQETEADPPVSISSFDGLRRWTSARELFGFPLAIWVGLSVEEQLAAAHRATCSYYWRAALGSLAVIILAMVLGRMSWQLAQGRIRESETKLAHARRVEYMAYHDGLTGLPNRSMFSKLLSQSLTAAHRYRRRLGVAFLDLDRFKQINDTLGHEAGDQLLQEVAQRLRTCLRDSDTVARLGGDEFVVLLPQIDEFGDAAVVAEKILAAIARPFTLIGHEFRVTTSIGISVFPRDGLDEQTLTKNADVAMYKAKASGKNTFQFYSDGLNANSLERLTLQSSLRRALEREEFRLCYQAKRDIRSGRVTGVEALLRWQHPDLGLVAPLQFIPMAEETGLIVPIGRWVLKTACAQNMAWQRAGAPSLNLAVNLTARQFFDANLAEDVNETLRATLMPASLLEFEISERLLIRDVEATLGVLTKLKTLGVRIAIDDFGTGYASLTTLKRFQLDTVKIDRTFVQDLRAGREGSGFADAVIALGKNLSATVVAQGVETSAQAEFLRTHACDELQGFYFNRPLPAEEFTRFLLEPPFDTSFSGRHPELRSAS